MVLLLNELFKVFYIYKDLNLFFTKHPLTADVSKVTDVQAIKRSVRNLVLTNKGERVGQPTFGADIFLTLFEPMGDELITSVEEKISEAMADWLPHVLVNKLVVEPDEVEVNQMNIELEFSLTMNPTVYEAITLSFATGE